MHWRVVSSSHSRECMHSRRFRSASAPAHCLITVQAVHRSGPGGHERHLRRLSAVGADDVVQHARAPVPVRRPTCRTALGAAPGLVLEAPRLVKLLLPCREEELPIAVTARQRPIHEAHRLASLEWFSRSEARGGCGPSYPLRVADRDSNSLNRTLENWS